MIKKIFYTVCFISIPCFAMQPDEPKSSSVNTELCIVTTQPKPLTQLAFEKYKPTFEQFISLFLNTDNPSQFLTIENLSKMQALDAVESLQSELNTAKTKIITSDDRFRGCAEYIIEPFSELSKEAVSVKWSPNDRYLACLTKTDCLLIFDKINKNWINGGIKTSDLRYLQSNDRFSWSENSKYIAYSGELEWTIIDLVTNTQANTIFIPFKNFLTDVEIVKESFSNPKWLNNCLILKTKPYVTLFNPENGEYIPTQIKCNENSVDQAPIKKLLWEMKEKNSIHIKDSQTEKEYAIKISEEINYPKVSPNNNYIALIALNHKTSKSFEYRIYHNYYYKIYIFNSKTNTIYELQHDHIETINCSCTLVWSPDEKFLAVAGHDIIHIFDIEKGTCIYEFKAGYQKIYAIEWSPSNKQIAVTSRDYTYSHYTIAIVDLFPLPFTLTQTAALYALIKNPIAILEENYTSLKSLFDSASNETKDKITPILEKQTQEFSKKPDSNYSIITHGIVSSCVCLGAARLITNPVQSLIQIIRNTDTDVSFEEPSW